jgi:hypothetical protein
LAKLLGDATEQLSMKMGQTLGGLLNATWVADRSTLMSALVTLLNLSLLSPHFVKVSK